MDIFISGIPKGLDQFSVSKHIRQSVATVAQVQDIWVHPTKGYGFITLFDATSTDYVLFLNDKILVNGGIIKLRRKQKQQVKKPIQSPRRINTFAQSTYSGGLRSYGQSEYTNPGGYTTYTDYQHDRPCPDTLYNYVQQVPTCRKKKNKPWKDVTRRTTIPTPKSGSTGKVRRRHCRRGKKTGSRNKDLSWSEFHKSKRKLCISTYKEEITTKSLPLNRKGSKNNHQPVNFPGLKNKQLATDILGSHLIVDHPKYEDFKPITNFPLDQLLMSHPGSRDIEPIKNVPLYSLVVGNPGLGDSSPNVNFPSEQVVLDPNSPGDINPIINIHGSHGVVDHPDDGFEDRSLITQDVPLDHTLAESFSLPYVRMDTDGNNIAHHLVNVNLYDSKYLFSANIANNSVIESLGDAIWKHCKIPPKSYILTYNGKVLDKTFTPYIENEANIHIVVKGKGGMKEGDQPETKQQCSSTENDSDIPTGQQTDMTYRLSSEADTWTGCTKEGNHTKTMQRCTTTVNDSDISTGHQAITTVYSRLQADQEEKTVKADNPSETIQKRNISENENDISQGKGGMNEGDQQETNQQCTSTENDSDIPTGQQTDKTDRLSSKADTWTGCTKEGNPTKTMQQCTTTVNDSDISTEITGQTNTTVYLRLQADNEEKTVKADNPSETIQKRDISENENDISQAQDTVLQVLGLKEYFPNKLTKQDVMCISDDEDRKPEELKDIPWVILRKIIMLDISGRDRVSSDFYDENDNHDDVKVDFISDHDNWDEEKDDTDDDEQMQSKQMKLHPIDIFMSIYLCLHPILQQHICTKMFTCHQAVPFIYRQPTPNKPLMLSLWPFRNINVNNGERDISIINCKQHVISFVRLGRPYISKSVIANLILSANNHHTFFNIDCPLGNTDRLVSTGLVEAAWFIPSTLTSNQEQLSGVAMLLNLRGDALQNQPQMDYLKIISDLVIVAIDDTVTKDFSTLDVFQSIKCNILFLVSGEMPNRNLRSIYTRMKSIMPDKCLVNFVKTTNTGVPLGKNILKSVVFKHIKGCLRDNTNTRTFFQVCKVASEMNLVVDEYSSIFSEAKEKAYQVFKTIEDVALVDVRRICTKLQVGPWRDYNVEKRKLKKGNSLKLREKDQLTLKMKDLESTESRPNHTDMMKLFIPFVMNTCDIELVYFLEYLIFYLDENFRQKYAELRVSLTDTWKSPTYESENAYRCIERDMSDASFGIEHLFREIGLLYEFKSLTEGTRFAEVVAKTIRLGFPFEIMDGDVGDIPLGWVKAVFDELKISIGGKKVFTISIIGLQSSGKSTLLNAMFGVSFPVSAGRCTRGIYMQLFPVSKGKFKFDYVIVLDTEGLRASEEVNTQYRRDNELATLAIGLADLCIVNIKGENTCEVQNILQVCVHAFLRLKQANAKLCLNQSCIFTHQNVPDVNRALLNQRIKLEETLDMLTTEAAEEENMTGVKHFRDVIGFDRTDHIWYFPDLWQGNPPMAQVNEEYSRKVQIVKSLIFQKLATEMTAYFQTISELFVHLNDLWSGILANDFVFSFKNTLELRAYKALQNKFREILLNLESFVNSVDYLARISMQGYSSECELLETYRTNGEVYTEKFNKISANLKFDLENYFKNGQYDKIINSWKLQQMKNWHLATKGEKNKMDTILYSLYLQKRGELVMHVSLDEIKRDLSNKAETLAATILASKREEGVEDKLDVDRCFEEMWKKQVGNLNIQPPESTDIEKCLCDELKHAFEDDAIIVQREISSIWQCKTYETPRISDAVRLFAIDNTLVTLAANNPFKQLANAVLKHYHEKTILHFTRELFEHVDTIFDQLRQRALKFDDTEIKKIFFYIREKVNKFNRENEGKISFTETYTIRVAVFVCDFARPLLQRLDNEYKEKHSLQAKLGEHRDLVYRHFQDLTSQKKLVIVASNYVCNAIRKYIRKFVTRRVNDKIYDDSLKQCRSKETLLVKILNDLATNNDFMCYLTYIHDPRNYASIWLKHFVNDICFMEPSLMYYIRAFEIMDLLFLQIKECINSNQEQEIENWLLHFNEKLQKILPTQSLSLEPLKDQKALDIIDFKKTLKEKLVQMQDDLNKEFREVDDSNIKWSDKTPYEKMLDHLWGCDSVCPFCEEPCVLEKDHTEMVDHRCIQHRPNGLIMRFWNYSRKLSIENCNIEVGSDSTYACGPICTRGPPESHKIGILRQFFVELGFQKFHAYSDYKEFFPHWHIVSCPDVSSSVYWAWVMCQHNAQFASYYDKREANIPQSWKLYKKQDAINSLPSLDSL